MDCPFGCALSIMVDKGPLGLKLMNSDYNLPGLTVIGVKNSSPLKDIVEFGDVLVHYNWNLLTAVSDFFTRDTRQDYNEIGILKRDYVPFWKGLCETDKAHPQTKQRLTENQPTFLRLGPGALGLNITVDNCIHTVLSGSPLEGRVETGWYLICVGATDVRQLNRRQVCELLKKNAHRSKWLGFSPDPTGTHFLPKIGALKLTRHVDPDYPKIEPQPHSTTNGNQTTEHTKHLWIRPGELGVSFDREKCIRNLEHWSPLEGEVAEGWYITHIGHTDVRDVPMEGVIKILRTHAHCIKRLGFANDLPQQKLPGPVPTTTKSSPPMKRRKRSASDSSESHEA